MVGKISVDKNIKTHDKIALYYIQGCAVLSAYQGYICIEVETQNLTTAIKIFGLKL